MTSDKKRHEHCRSNGDEDGRTRCENELYVKLNTLTDINVNCPQRMVCVCVWVEA